jgi:hypothetical protein
LIETELRIIEALGATDRRLVKNGAGLQLVVFEAFNDLGTIRGEEGHAGKVTPGIQSIPMTRFLAI